MPLFLLQFLLLLLSIVITGTNAQDCAANGVCDGHPRCPVWKQEGECAKSAGYMKKHCPVSCGYAATAIKSQTAAELMEESIQFGVKQEAVGESAEQTLDVISKSIEYMKEPRDVHFCKNKHEHCSFWATVGTFYSKFSCMRTFLDCLISKQHGESMPMRWSLVIWIERRSNLLKLILSCSHIWYFIVVLWIVCGSIYYFLKLYFRRMWWQPWMDAK